MPKIFINNNEIEANSGETIIQVASKNGIDIPYFCWHPEMSIGGNCRMCLVEVGSPKRNPDGSFALDENNHKIINYMPKLQIACNTVVMDEMRVNTNTQKVVDTRAAVMEFILINHPLDCPICDEAGQCKLQKYSEKYSTSGSRFSETKNQSPKRMEWNEKIIYDSERCISCSRCIRFTSEIMNENVLTFINRGDRVRIDRFEDAKIQNDYSMNVIDNCPVGALTSKDFRFKARVWEMSFNDSICTGCSRGCNIKIGSKNNQILRVEPRENMQVNKYWMCDYGRLSMPSQINDKRLSHPKVRINGVLEENAKWDTAIFEAVALLKKFNPNEIFIIASALASNESNHLVVELAKKINVHNIGFVPRVDENFGDNFLKRNDKSPNQAGVKALGIEPINQSELISKILSKEIKCVLVLDEDFTYCEDLVIVFPKLTSLIIFSTRENNAVKFSDVTFAVAECAEYDGSFTNCDNIIQHFKSTFLFAEDLQSLEKLSSVNRSRLDIFGSHNDKWNQKIERDIKPSQHILKEILKNFG